MRITVTTNRLKYYMEILSITTFITCTTIQQYNTFLITYINLMKYSTCHSTNITTILIASDKQITVHLLYLQLYALSNLPDITYMLPEQEVMA